MGNTQEINRIFAEFIGLKTGEQLGKDRWPSDWFDNEGIINGHRNTYLLFDTSFDWLMPLVFKCLGICHENMLNEWEEAFKNSFTACDILIVYKITFEFIQWYNLNQVEPQLKEQTGTT